MDNKIFVVADIHGAHKALVQCLDRCGIDRKNDTLISLGDIADGFDEVCECVEELLTIDNLIAIKGNHDDVFNEWLNTSINQFEWSQGGIGTLQSYAKYADVEIMIDHYRTDEFLNKYYKTNLNTGDIKESHKKFFRNQILYYIDKNRLFVHGGFNRNFSLSENKANDPSQFYWDRNLWKQAMSSVGNQKLKTVDNFDEIFIGHTATVGWTENKQIIRDSDNKIIKSYSTPITTPMHRGGVWNLDTGAGFIGKLTIMDIDTKEYWQSDSVKDLYPTQQLR